MESLLGALITKVAHPWGIEVRFVDGVPFEERSPAEGDYGCDTKKRIVYVNSRVAGSSFEPQWFFHELVHVIVQPPMRSIENIDEGWMMIPFERWLAREIGLVQRFEQMVIDLQDATTTAVPINDEGKFELFEVGHFNAVEKTPWWLAAMDRLQRVGLLRRGMYGVMHTSHSIYWDKLTPLDWKHANPKQGRRAPNPPYEVPRDVQSIASRSPSEANSNRVSSDGKPIRSFGTVRRG